MPRRNRRIRPTKQLKMGRSLALVKLGRKLNILIALLLVEIVLLGLGIFHKQAQTFLSPWKLLSRRASEGAGLKEPLPAHPVRLEILNGCGIDGLARTARNYLRKKGFDIRDSRDADRWDYERTLVIDRVGKLENAHKVADALGVDEDAVLQQLNPDLVDIDVTVVLGKDYRRLWLFKGPK